jgi:tetratricopeptide (TPR) repeat protein
MLQTIQSPKTHFGSKKGACWVVPFERNHRYVDREVVGKVKRRLFVKCQPERIAIFGLGGVGKTQIALELAYQTRDLYPDCAIFWLPAVDMESLQQAYQTVADELGISPFEANEDVKSVVKKYLSEPSAGRWLLILDNADEMDMWIDPNNPSNGGLKDYLPMSDKGAIVFTTRNTKVAQHLASADVIEIPEMDEQRATHVLQKCLVDHDLLHDVENTRKLLNRLTYLPLAIVQAASFINENRMTLKVYVDLLDTQEQSAIELLSEDFEDKGRYKCTRNPVATTWLTSFEQIRRQNPTAANYLCVMACLQEKDIPISLLPHMAEVEQKKTLGVLSSYSFLRVRHEVARLDMHRLVHLATRNWLRSINSLQMWQLNVLNGLGNYFPKIEMTHRNSWRAAIPHALRILDLTADEDHTADRLPVLLKVGMCQNHDGRPREAEIHFNELLQSASELDGPECNYSIMALDGLAESHSRQGNSAKAIELCKEIVQIQTRVHGPGSFHVNFAISRLSTAYREGGDNEKSGELCKEVILYFINTLGPGSCEAMDAIYGLVLSYTSQGRISDAAELSLQLLNISRKVFGSNHPRTTGAMTALGIIYMEQWRLQEAGELFAEALEVNTRILGPEDTDTMRAAGFMATLWGYQGRHDDAIALKKECVRLCRQAYGADHRMTKAQISHLEKWTTPK